MPGFLDFLRGSGLADHVGLADEPDGGLDPASRRVAQAFETAVGGDRTDRSARDRVVEFAQGLAKNQPASQQPSRSDSWAGQRNGPMASGHFDLTQAVPGGAELSPEGGDGWRDLLGALAPAVAAADPWGRNQALANTLMQQQQDRRQEVEATRSQNQTRNWLVGQGMDAGTADLLVNDPALLRRWFIERQRLG